MSPTVPAISAEVDAEHDTSRPFAVRREAVWVECLTQHIASPYSPGSQFRHWYLEATLYHPGADTAIRNSARSLLICACSLVAIWLSSCLDPCSNCTSVQAPTAFSNTGPMSAARAFHTATRIASNGVVLITGGEEIPGLLDTAEIVSTSSKLTDSLASARSNHTASVLSGGDVLVAGGVGGQTVLQTAELFQAANEKFSAVGIMFAPRAGHTATVLKNGRVLIAGGSPELAPSSSHFEFLSGALDSAELYEPNLGNFVGVTQAMVAPRSEHTATLLKDGRVLLAGGFDNNGIVLDSAEVFDPRDGSFSAVGPMSTPRRLHTATLLADQAGTVLIVGGEDNNGTDLATAELFDPVSARFTLINACTNSANQSGCMTTTRSAQTATLLQDGTVLVVGGQHFDATAGTSVSLASAEIYSPNAETFTATAAPMAASRLFHTATVLENGTVLISGGRTGADGTFSTLAGEELYDPVAKTFSSGPNLTHPREQHTASLLQDGTVLMVGGSSSNTSVFAGSETYNPATGIFSASGAMATPRFRHAATMLTTGKVLIVGGTNQTQQVLSAAELYNPATGTFQPSTQMLGTARSDPTATLLGDTDGTVLIAGGCDSNGNALASAELYHPSTDSFSATGSMVAFTGRVQHTAVLLQDGTVLVAGGLTGTGACSTSKNSSFGLDTAEIYNPVTGLFAATTGGMKVARFSHTATLLRGSQPAGRVLIAGGSGDLTAELYDPATGMFTETRGLMTAIRVGQTATQLSDTPGMVLLTGGASFNASSQLVASSSAELYDPASEEFTAVGAMHTTRVFHTATLLSNGMVLVAGGQGTLSTATSAELFDLSKALASH